MKTPHTGEPVPHFPHRNQCLHRHYKPPITTTITFFPFVKQWWQHSWIAFLVVRLKYGASISRVKTQGLTYNVATNLQKVLF
jgi:hypothetical protein